jgi:RNA polymerase sporulation-specific sigma factor
MIAFGTTARQNDAIGDDLDHCPYLIAAARSGVADAFAQLFRIHRPRIFALTRRYFAPGWDRDDLIQEATIGFFKAVRDFKEHRGSFASFVDLCVRRQIITFIKTATRQKHAALNHAVSMDMPIFEDSDETLITRLSTGGLANSGEVSDTLEFLSTLWGRCSDLERGVFSMYSKGYSFTEMAWELGVRLKSIDNAVWRVKVKARRLLGQRRFAGLPIRTPAEREPQSA